MRLALSLNARNRSPGKTTTHARRSCFCCDQPARFAQIQRPTAFIFICEKRFLDHQNGDQKFFSFLPISQPISHLGSASVTQASPAWIRRQFWVQKLLHRRFFYFDKRGMVFKLIHRVTFRFVHAKFRLCVPVDNHRCLTLIGSLGRASFLLILWIWNRFPKIVDCCEKVM